MAPPALHDLFLASAGVAGALVGLLFVAISVAGERLSAEEGEQVHRVRAAAALTSFTNALVISLFALVPGVSLGWTAFAVSISGLAFVVASLVSVYRVYEAEEIALRELLFLLGLIVIFGFQLWFALRLTHNEQNTGAARGIAILVIIFFLVGIARSWELIGGPSIGLGHELTGLRRDRRTPPEKPEP
jgi:hypothetical protein